VIQYHSTYIQCMPFYYMLPYDIHSMVNTVMHVVLSLRVNHSRQDNFLYHFKDEIIKSDSGMVLVLLDV
jgi:hypothetical protein